MKTLVQLSDDDMAWLRKAMADPEWAFRQLPKAEQEMYEEARQSCVDAAIWSRPRRAL